MRGPIAYTPSDVVGCVVETPVATLVAVTVACGMTAPVASVTVPWMEPSPAVCAAAGMAGHNREMVSPSSNVAVLTQPLQFAFFSVIETVFIKFAFRLLAFFEKRTAFVLMAALSVSFDVHFQYGESLGVRDSGCPCTKVQLAKIPNAGTGRGCGCRLT